MRNVNTIARVSDRELKGMSKTILDLAGKTAQAPKTLAAGLYDIVSSGFKGKDAMTILEKSAYAASAGMTDTATSTKAVVAVLNAYGLGADQAGKVADQLFGIVDRGVISFEELARQIGDVLPFGNQLGVGLDQLGASVATLTKGGMPSAIAMTALKGALVAFIRPSKEMAAAVHEAGYANGEALIKARGFQGALEAVSKASGGTASAMTGLFPDVQGLAGALALTGAKAKDARADLDAMGDVTGKTGKAFAEQSKGYEFQKKRFVAALTVAGIELGEGLLPGLTEGAKEFASAIGEMSDSGDLTQMGKDIGGVVTALAEAGPEIAAGMTLAGQSVGVLFDLFKLGANGMAAAVLAPIELIMTGLLAAAKVANKLNPFGDVVDTSGLEKWVDKVNDFRQSATAAASDVAHDVGNMAKTVDSLSDKKATIKIKGDPADAEAALKKVQGMRLSEKVMKILGKDISAADKIKQIRALGIDAKTARILGQNADALAKIGSVRGALAALPNSKQINVNVITTSTKVIGDSVSQALGKAGKKRAAGRGPDGAERALVGEGRGPELVAGPDGMQWVTKPTVMDLGAGDYVIPTDPAYGGRALGLMFDLLGMTAYAKGKKPKKAAAKRKRAVPPRQDYLRLSPEEFEAQYDAAKEKSDDRYDKGPQKGKLTPGARKARGQLSELRARSRRAKGYSTQISTQDELANIAADAMALADKRDDQKGYDAALGKRKKALSKQRSLLAAALKIAKPGSKWARDIQSRLGRTSLDIEDSKAAAMEVEETAAQIAAREAMERLADTGMTDDERATLARLDKEQSLSALTPGLDDDQAAAGSKLSFLERVLQDAIVNPAVRGGDSVIGDLADQVKQARDNVASFAGGGSAGNDNADLAAQLAQRDEQLRVAKRESEINARSLSVFQGTGDLGSAAWRPGITQNIYTLHPGDPATQRAISDAAVSGMDQQASRQSPRSDPGL